MALMIDIVPASAEFERAVVRTAEVLEQIDKTEKSINAVASKLGKSYQQVADALTQIEKDDTAMRKKEALATREQANAAKRQENAARNALNAEKKEQKERKKTLYDILAIGGAIVAAATAGVALAGGFAVAAMRAAKGREETAALINALTDGNGPKFLRLLDSLAGKLGESILETRQKFIEFREAGANNKVSFALLKLRADLKALGLSAKDVDKEMAFVLDAKGGTTAETLAKQLAIIKEISGFYKIAGDGSLAASKASTSLESATNKLGDVVDGALADIWKEIGPSIGVAANAVAKFLDEFIKSKEGQEMIKGIGSAFKTAAGAVAPFLDFVRDHGDVIRDVLVVGMAALGAAVLAVAAPLIAAQAAALSFIGTAAAVGAAVGLAAVAVGRAFEFIADHWKEIEDFAEKAFDWGASVVDGIVRGIKNGIGKATKAITELASSISGAFTDALGIKSPSKLFAEYGRNTVEGYEQGQRQTLRGPMPLQETAAVPIDRSVATQAGAQLQASARSQAVSSGVTIEQLIVNGGGDAEVIARAVRQEIQMLLMAQAHSRGLA